MYELIQVSENCYYIDCPAKIGLVRYGTDVFAIDGGSDKDAGKKVLRAIEANGWHLTAIYNTHCHADHIGGNHYLQAQTGCKIYAAEVERDFVNHPHLESAFLFGGFPFEALKHKLLLAQPSQCDLLTDDVLPKGMEIIPLPGHCFGQVGYRTADDVVYVGDALASDRTLEKYGLVFIWDVAAYLESLERLKTMTAKCFVPAHAEAVADIAPLAQRNMDSVLQAADRIAGFCAAPTQFDDLLQQVFTAYDLTMSPQQYVLIGSALRSYLTYLQNCGRMEYIFDDNRMLWVAKS